MKRTVQHYTQRRKNNDDNQDQNPDCAHSFFCDRYWLVRFWQYWRPEVANEDSVKMFLVIVWSKSDCCAAEQRRYLKRVKRCILRKFPPNEAFAVFASPKGATWNL
jgi:hypothetical protein